MFAADRAKAGRASRFDPMRHGPPAPGPAAGTQPVRLRWRSSHASEEVCQIESPMPTGEHSFHSEMVGASATWLASNCARNQSPWGAL